MYETKTLIIAHFDGHGVATGALAARRLGVEQGRIIVQYPITGPNDFARIEESIAPGLLYSATDIYILDIAINVKDPDAHIRTLHRIFNNARKLTRSYVSINYYDHHDSNLQFLQMLPQFLKYVHFPSALTLSLNFADRSNENEVKLAVIGAVCDRDSTTLNKEYIDLFGGLENMLEYASGLDVLVRKDIREAINICYNLHLEQLLQYAKEIPEPDYNSVEVHGPVAIYTEQLQEGWGPKMLEKIAIKFNVPYAIGFENLANQSQWIVRAVTLWTSQAPPVRNYISTSRTVIGHPSAPTVAALSESDAINLAREIAESIARNYSIQQTEKTIVSAQESFIKLFSVLTNILEEQRKLYREYLELKRKQVELLESATDSQRTRYD